MCQKMFSQGQSILSRKQFLMGRRLKKVRGAHLFQRGKKIRNLILSVRNETRYSKIDQENITHLKDKWMDYGDVLFKPFKKHIVVKDDGISGKQTHYYILFYLFICSLVLFVFM